jgi:hypothetical protein
MKLASDLIKTTRLRVKTGRMKSLKGIETPS